MSETFNPTHGEPLEGASDKSEQPTANQGEATLAEPRLVGFGHPPPDQRWKKGGPSPNPRGRPRKEQSMLPDVHKAFEQAINKKVSVPLGDKKVLMTRIEIGLEQLLNQFAKGDRHARKDLMDYADKLGIDFLAKHKQGLERALAPNYQAVLDAFLARRSDAADAAPTPRVIAPPELLDDDTVESEPTSPSLPKLETKPKISLPTPIPGNTYPKPPERMTRTELASWYPDWWAEHGNAWEEERLRR